MVHVCLLTMQTAAPPPPPPPPPPPKKKKKYPAGIQVKFDTQIVFEAVCVIFSNSPITGHSFFNGPVTPVQIHRFVLKVQKHQSDTVKRSMFIWGVTLNRGELWIFLRWFLARLALLEIFFFCLLTFMNCGVESAECLPPHWS